MPDIDRPTPGAKVLNPLLRFIAVFMLVASPFGAVPVNALFGVGVGRAQAQSLVRDAEIEATIRAYATPLLQAAGQPVDAVRIRIINDKSLNAFVTTGRRMFIHSGLLMRSENASQIIGVIAHEIGHISGGHIVRLKDEIGAAQMTSLIAAAVGVLAGVATGRGDIGAAVTKGGQISAVRAFLGFSRTQESSADAFAMRVLDATGQSARGLREFFDILGDQELLRAERQDPYFRTHPLSQERIQDLESHLARSRYTNARPSAEFERMHARMRAKLIGFLEPRQTALREYPASDMSEAGRYARAIAYYRGGRLDEAVPAIDALIRDFPGDPYYFELKGQMLYENQRGIEALPAYEESVRLAPDEPLLRQGLAQALVATGEKARLEAALEHLEVALRFDRQDIGVWDLIGRAHAGLGNGAQADAARAETEILKRNLSEAKFFAGRAEKGLPKGSPTWLRMQDIKNVVVIAREDEDR